MNIPEKAILLYRASVKKVFSWCGFTTLPPKNLNSAFAKTFGYDIGDIPTLDDWWSMAHHDPEYRDWVVAEWKRHLDRAKSEQIPFEPFEVKINCKNGSLRTVLVGASTLHETFDGWHLVVLYDITERKRADEIVQKVSGQLKSVIESTGDIIAMMDTDYRYVLFNSAFHDEFKKIYGQDLKPGDSVPQVLGHVPSDLADAMAYWNRALAGEDFTITQQFGDAALARNWYDLHFSPTRNHEGKITGAVHVVRNATQRKQAEEAQRKSGEKFHSVFNNALDGILFGNPSGSVFAANPAACEMLGRSQEEICEAGKDVVVDITDPRLPLALEERKQKGQFRGELNFRRKDGTIFPVELSSVIFSFESEPQWASTIFRDITNRKQAEKEKDKLEAINRQLQKSESLGRMAGAVAHHFNNQLQAVIMNLDLLRGELPKNAEGAESLTGAMSAALKAAEVSSLMLTYLGQTSAKREPLDLSEVCRRAQSLFRAIFPANVALETNLPSPGPSINANANQIQQALSNLLTNAWEASSTGPNTIRLTVKTVSSTEISATQRFPIDTTVQNVPYACLEVADSGCGIAAQDIDKIFDPFYSTKFVGRGMGLAAVLGIVRSHRGVITVESQPGRASIFRVFFPVITEAVAVKQVPVAQNRQTSKAAEGCTILLVEDEPSVRLAVAKALKRSGFTVLTAVDGVDALDVFQKRHAEIHCVLSDLTMPRMDGWQTLEGLRKLKPGIPVILASGYSEDQVMCGNHSEWPQAFLNKPYELKPLLNSITRVLAANK